MADQFDGDIILDLTRSEVKRWGGDGPTLTHASWVFAERWRADFDEVFGATGRDALAAMMREGRFHGSEDQLIAILDESADRGAVLRALYAALRSEFTSAASSADAGGPGSDAAQAPDGTGGTPSSTTVPVTDDAADALGEGPAKVLRRVVADDAIEGRDHEAVEIAAQVVRAESVVTALVGDKGAGRTATLAVVAGVLAALRTPVPVWRFGPDTIIANPASTLRMVLSNITSPAVIVVDDLDILASLATDHPDRELLSVIADARFHARARLVVVLNRRYNARLSVI
ncbi:MAG: hypothetical protein LBK72_09785, partial [Bifidobacteriaceae bacterium]|nr:hypothetical protein [Bifidobacteriaceae bacterium]